MDVKSRLKISIAAAALALTLGIHQSAFAGFVVNAWLLESGIRDTVPPGQSSFVYFTTPQSPFINHHEASLGISTATSDYQFTYDDSSAYFHTTSTIAAAGNPQLLFSVCDGGVRFATDTDVVVSLDGSFSYALPPGDREAYFSMEVSQPTPFFNYFFQTHDAAPVFGDPSVGTFTIHADAVLLPANGTYDLTYVFELYSFGGNPAVVSTGQGNVTFHIEVIPEPTTFALLALAAIPFSRRRRAFNRL